MNIITDKCFMCENRWVDDDEEGFPFCHQCAEFVFDEEEKEEEDDS
tara:strand:+ start:156 stop:293 length:138 start_codon:yes stop_codon:yes gene_type:complete